MLQQFTERKSGVVGVALRAGRQRAANVAAQLSRRGRLAASAELCNEAVVSLLRLAWQADTDGCAANVDQVTGRLLVPAPWGDNGYRAYGLRSTEGRALRAYMMGLQNRPDAPVFTYDGVTRSWYLNIFDHTPDSSLAYWKKWGMTDRAYRDLVR
jgi:hypothetical protein